MKNVYLALMAILLITGQATHANDNLGIGVAIGSPIGIHYKYKLDSNSRVEGAVGSSIINNSTSIDTQYVTTTKNKFKLQAYDLNLNTGYGAKVLTGKKSKVGPSGLLGVAHIIEHTQFTILANSGAALLFGDGISLDLNLYLAANYQF